MLSTKGKTRTFYNLLNCLKITLSPGRKEKKATYGLLGCDST
jgi:hypothetical protein